jgi:hypothetical protein
VRVREREMNRRIGIRSYGPERAVSEGLSHIEGTPERTSPTLSRLNKRRRGCRIAEIAVDEVIERDGRRDPSYAIYTTADPIYALIIRNRCIYICKGYVLSSRLGAAATEVKLAR